ncbi:hypothetical protein SAMN02745157_0193 [Kaistia soli DSM 19436]|uniref:Uncharacterized protein n=1 Tax=Kaistia soli DSM 19436 TaxID=1122133 RepID=A0A1M5PNH6_9HYPH|nr:hypothetical protein SAMN02745157_0193 [Kaistia soli DSM 19436]
MFHPESINHCGAQYSLGHLNRALAEFRWKTAEKVEVTYSVRIDYSTHCYSDAGLPRVAGSYIVNDGSSDRIFCPSRHEYSLHLPQIVDGLFAKPTTSVALATTGNWFVYRLTMAPALPQGEIYYVFFRMHPSPVGTWKDGAINLDLYVESAYSRANPVASAARMPFGKAVERRMADLSL